MKHNWRIKIGIGLVGLGFFALIVFIAAFIYALVNFHNDSVYWSALLISFLSLIFAIAALFTGSSIGSRGEKDD